MYVLRISNSRQTNANGRYRHASVVSVSDVCVNLDSTHTHTHRDTHARMNKRRAAQEAFRALSCHSRLQFSLVSRSLAIVRNSNSLMCAGRATVSPRLHPAKTSFLVVSI